MVIKDTEFRLDANALRSLELPSKFDDYLVKSAMDIDRVLDQKGSFDQFSDTIDIHRQAGLAQLYKRKFADAYNPARFSWPESLFIPTGANYSDYWITPPPDKQRFALAWKSPADGPNRASVETGNVFAFCQLKNDAPTTTQSSSASVGVFYEPSMTLGVVDFQPAVHFEAEFRTVLEYSQLSAGGVQFYAELLLACWQLIPGPQKFDFIGLKRFNLATSGRIDQSFGKELQQFENSFNGSELSAPFVVQRGHKYLFAVEGRITIKSNLTLNTGKPLPIFNGKELKVWGYLNCLVPQINIFTKRVDLP